MARILRRSVIAILGALPVTIGTKTTTSVALSWAGRPGVSSYVVQYKLAAATAWTTASSNVAALTYNVTGLTTATAYDFRVTFQYKGTTSNALAIRTTTS